MAEDRRSQRPARGGKPPAASPRASPPAAASPTSVGVPAPSAAPVAGRTAAAAASRSVRARVRPARATGSVRRPTRRRSAEQARYDGPELPEEITGRELDRSVTAQLKGLPEKLAARVARHLAAAGMLVEEDPEKAYQHTLAARARASRLAVVREATGEAAYAAGHYAEALSELRAAKRMNGVTAYLPMMADCHRALGQPEQALKLAKSPAVANFAPERRPR